MKMRVLWKLAMFVLTCNSRNSVVGQFLSTPDDVSAACVGIDVTLDWRFDHEDELEYAMWQKNRNDLMTKVGSQPAVPESGVTNIQHISNGAIKIIGVSLVDGGIYSLQISYPLTSLLPKFPPDSVNVTVLAPPSVPTFRSTTSGQQTTYHCETASTGTPAVDVKIKIGGVLQDSSNSMVDYTKPVDCCVVGEASQCILENTNKTTEYCVNAITPSGPDSMQLSPNTTTYILNVGESLGPVVCSATCVPTCTFRWSKGLSTISNNATLSSVIQDKNDRGTYACTATRGMSVTTRSVTVYVIYGPDAASFNPSGPIFTKNEDSSLSVQCTSECFPGCAYSWTKSGTAQTVATSSTLSFNPLKRDNATEYICTVSNTNSSVTVSATATATVVVRYGPDPVSFSPAGPSFIENEGDQLTVHCISSCHPGCSYIWTKQGQRGSVSTTTTDTLYFSGVQRSHAGSYTCTVENTYSGITATQTGAVTLNVRYGPNSISFSPASPPYTKNEGDQLTFRCISSCYPGCSYTWTKQGQSVSTNDTLYFSDVRTSHAGSYTCTVRNAYSGITATRTGTVTLNVRYGPDNIVLQPDNASPSCIEGHVLPDISCSSECYPECTETWWNITGNTQLGNGNVLSLGPVYRSYTGAYNCSSTNQAVQYNKSFSRSIYLTVQYFPDVNIYKLGNSETSELDSTLTIECTAKGEPDAIFYDVTHLAPNQVKVRDLPGTKGNEKMVVDLSNISYMDSGFYVCTVSNGIENYITHALNATNKLNLVVKGKPYISESNKTIIDVAVGSNLTVNVSFYSNDGSEPGVRWFRIMNDSQSEVFNSTEERYRISTFDDDVPVSYYGINTIEQGSTTQLIIDNVDAEDFRAYKVIINNTVGVVNHTVTLAPRGPPEKPYNFAVVDESKTTSSITLTWFSGFHGGADQVFHIMYKTKTSQWQEWSPVFGGKQSHVQFSEMISHLDQGTFYSFKIYANNTFGPSYNSSAIHAKTNAVPDKEEPSSITAAAVGGGVGGALVIVVVIVGVVLVRRRSSKKDSKDDVKKLSSDHNRNKDNDDDVEVANPMYESAGDLPTTSNNNLYAVVDKSKKGSSKPAPEDKNLYAVVKKPKKNEEKVQQSELYSLPVKKSKDTPNKKEKPKKEKGKQKQKKKGKPEDSKDGLVYENATSMSNPTKDSKNVYENPSFNTVDEEAKPKCPSRTQNPDGLIYLEVEVPKTSNNADRRLIIHGLEDRNDYADIAFGKIGEPAPESDEEPEKKE